ncbi:MAG: CinA family nicotinamide mononucleotide deamidase-related protein [Desulfosoma sp.]|uniref:CinA family nicotinamide mononucleotide deamidase-related protein n=1 Tax=Desulfosoma sp. TaxID=2603217 RepID=UPI0040493FDA
MDQERCSEIRGSLLTIGDEILLGDILNTNAHHIAGVLRAHGFRLQRVVVVEDAEEAIALQLEQLTAQSRFVIVTGGLGPTDDDRTKSAVTRAFALPMAVDEADLKGLMARVKARGGQWSDRLGRLAQLPQGAVRLAPGRPMAGFSLEHRGVPCYFLPGVPHEMETLLQEVVLPDLMRRFPERPACAQRVLRIYGLMETEINERLSAFDAVSYGVKVGYLPQTAENWVTLLASATDTAEAQRRLNGAEKELVSLLGLDYVIGRDDESLEKVVGTLLRQRAWKLAVAESCTGGLLAARLTALPGASDYFDRGLVTYSNQAKSELLGVPQELLQTHGAVSRPVCEAMVQGVLERSKVQAALAVTGIAGPTGGSTEKPVGTVFIGGAVGKRTVVEQHHFQGSRPFVQEQSVQHALALLWRMLRS